MDSLCKCMFFIIETTVNSMKIRHVSKVLDVFRRTCSCLKEIQGSHYFSFFALSNFITQTCLNFCRTGQLTSSEHQIKSNQIKSLLLSHHHSTCALVREILESVLQTVLNNLHIDSTYIQTYTEDNVQNTHTYSQYIQCTHSVLLDILTVINTHYTQYVHVLHYVHIYTHTQ